MVEFTSSLSTIFNNNTLRYFIMNLYASVKRYASIERCIDCDRYELKIKFNKPVDEDIKSKVLKLVKDEKIVVSRLIDNEFTVYCDDNNVDVIHGQIANIISQYDYKYKFNYDNLITSSIIGLIFGIIDCFNTDMPYITLISNIVIANFIGFLLLQINCLTHSFKNNKK